MKLGVGDGPGIRQRGSGARQRSSIRYESCKLEVRPTVREIDAALEPALRHPVFTKSTTLRRFGSSRGLLGTTPVATTPAAAALARLIRIVLIVAVATFTLVYGFGWRGVVPGGALEQRV